MIIINEKLEMIPSRAGDSIRIPNPCNRVTIVCTVLCCVYCTVCTVLYCTMCTVRYCTMCTIRDCTVLCVLYGTVLRVLYGTVLYCAFLHWCPLSQIETMTVFLVTRGRETKGISTEGRLLSLPDY